jgi:hypothetical protein
MHISISRVILTCFHLLIYLLWIASIENVEKNGKKLDAWINSIRDLHRTKPPPSVLCSKSMPDIDKLKRCLL